MNPQWIKRGMGLLLLTLMMGCIQETREGNGVTEKQMGETPTYSLFEKYAQRMGKTMDETRMFFNQTYGIGGEEQVFVHLDAPPLTYEEEKGWLYDGNSESMGWISRETYERPEFYPTFSTGGMNAWINAPSEYPFSVGLVGTPSEQAITLTRDQREFTTSVFVGASWGVTTRQTGTLYADLQPDANISLTFTPATFFLERNFPQFEKGWVERIRIEGKISENILPGVYRMYVYARPPSESERGGKMEYYPVDPLFFTEGGLTTLEVTILP